MTKSTHNQHYYTELFLQAGGLSVKEIDTYAKIWWWNHTDKNHLRLSKVCVSYLVKRTGLKVHIITLSHPLLSKHLIDLARINLGPYYLHGKTMLFVLDDQVAAMLMLHAGNLDQYLANLKLD